MARNAVRFGFASLVIAGLACNLPGLGSSGAQQANLPATVEPTAAQALAAVIEPIEPLSPADLDRSEAAYLTVVFDRGGRSPAIRGWYSVPEDDPLILTPGEYLIMSVLTVEPGVPYVSQLSVEETDRYRPFEVGNPQPDPELAVAIEQLALFLLDAEGARLTALEASSGGFQDPLFESASPANGADLVSLSVAYQTAASHEASVGSALATLEDKGLVAAANGGAPLARPAAQDSWWDGIKDQFGAFFGEVSSSNQRSVERMRKVAAEMTPDEKAQTFGAISADSRGAAQDFDDMLDQAESGELPIVATNLEGLLNDDINYEPIARNLEQGAGQVLHQEGARLVVKGAELQVAITKTMLDTALPGISRGTEIADKINEYLEYAEDVYDDPLGQAEAAGREQLAGAISDRLDQALESCCADILSEEDRQQLAEGLGGSIVEQVPELAGQEEPAASTGQSGGSEGGAEGEGEEEPTPEPVSVSANGYFTESVNPSSVVLSTRLVLVADFENGYVSGNLTGSGQEGGVGTTCREDGGQGALIDRSYWDGTHVYQAEFTTEIDPSTGAFSAPISVDGSTDWVQSNPYQNERCLHLNVGSDSETWSGQGSVQGTVSMQGAVRLTTSWQASNRTVSGTFEGTGSVEAP